GFVRTYSTLLKLDVPQTMAALDAELGKTEKFSEPPPLTNEKRTPLDFVMLQFSKVDWRKGLLGLAVVAGITVVISVFFTWRHYRTRDPLKDLKPGVYHSSRTNSGETLPMSPAPRR